MVLNVVKVILLRHSKRRGFNSTTRGGGTGAGLMRRWRRILKMRIYTVKTERAFLERNTLSGTVYRRHELFILFI